RARNVTGVQTCALPISVDPSGTGQRQAGRRPSRIVAPALALGASELAGADDEDVATGDLDALCPSRRVQMLGGDGEGIGQLPGLGFEVATDVEEDSAGDEGCRCVLDAGDEVAIAGNNGLGGPGVPLLVVVVA